MRKLVVLSCVFLILSGIMLGYPEIFPWAEKSTAVSLLHIWGGIFFIVIFPLYSWGHIKGHSDRLRKISLVTATGVLQFFAGMGLIISGEAGIVKPDPEIYKLLINNYNLNPQHTIFIDDKEENIKAAELLGIHGIQFQNASKLRKDLQMLKLL